MTHAVALHTLRRFEAGELETARRAEVEAHAASCAECRAALDAMKAEAAALRTSFPFETLAARIEARQGVRGRARVGWLRWALAPAALAAAAGVAVLVVPAGEEPAVVRPKGGEGAPAPRLIVHARAPGAAEARPLAAGERVAQGWALRVEYDPASAKWSTLVGVDADGKLYLYHEGPAEPGRRLAPGSIVLDADRRPERLYAVFSDGPVPRASLHQGARAAAAAGIERSERIPGVEGEQASWLLVKQ